MEYIKKLNINFNNWDEIEYSNIEYFLSTYYKKCNCVLEITRFNYNHFLNYLKENNIKYKAASGININIIIDVLLNTYNKIYIYLKKDKNNNSKHFWVEKKISNNDNIIKF